MQSLAPNPQARYRSVTDGLKKMIVKEGLLRPVKGMGVMVIGAGPAHALYFSSYEKLKRVLSGTETGGKNPIAQMAAGTVSTMLHDAIMNPADVIKQRIQMYNSPYKNALTCGLSILKNEGLNAFYRSYPTQLGMNIPFHCTHLAIYEFTQEKINPRRIYNPTAHLISGGLAGALASAITTPLDVCKTLLNTQEANVLKSSKKAHIKGFVNAISIIYKCCGVRGYFNGLGARMMFSAPSTAISWTVYESFKSYLSLNNKLMNPYLVNKS